MVKDAGYDLGYRNAVRSKSGKDEAAKRRVSHLRPDFLLRRFHSRKNILDVERYSCSEEIPCHRYDCEQQQTCKCERGPVLQLEPFPEGAGQKREQHRDKHGAESQDKDPKKQVKEYKYREHYEKRRYISGEALLGSFSREFFINQFHHRGDGCAGFRGAIAARSLSHFRRHRDG